MRLTALSAGLILVLWSALLVADEHNVDFDSHVEFSAFKTFSIRAGKVASERPEINNPLLVKKVADAIRGELKNRRLKETTNNPDILVDFTITGVSYNVSTRGQRASIPPVLRGQPRVVIDTGPQRNRFSEATLVIDLTKRETNTMIWRGVYRNQEDNDSKLSQKLPGDVKKLFSDYPPQKQP